MIDVPPPDFDVTGFRDSYFWKAADDWYLILGFGIRDQGGTALDVSFAGSQMLGVPPSVMHGSG